MANTNQISDIFKEDTKSMWYSTAMEQAQFGQFNYAVLTLGGVISAAIAAPGSSLVEARDVISCDLGMNRNNQVLFNKCTIIALITGSLAISIIADRFGRIVPLMVVLILYGIFTMALPFCTHFISFTICSIFRAFGASATFCILLVYVAEVQTPRYRGSGICTIYMSWVLGSLIIPILNINWGLAQFMFGLVAVLCAAVVPSVFLRSPRFLLSTGRNSEAWETFKIIFALNTNQNHNEYSKKELVDDSDIQLTNLHKLQLYIPKTLQPPWYCTVISLQTQLVFNLCLFSMSWWFPEINVRHVLIFPSVFESIGCANDKGPLRDKYFPAALRVKEQQERLPNLETSCEIEKTDNYYHDEMMCIALTNLPFIVWMIIKIDSSGRSYFIILSHVIGGFMSFVVYFLINTPQSVLYTCIMESLLVVSRAAVSCLIIEFCHTKYRTLGIGIMYSLSYAGMLIGIRGWIIFEMNCVFIISILGILITSTLKSGKKNNCKKNQFYFRIEYGRLNDFDK